MISCIRPTIQPMTKSSQHVVFGIALCIWDKIALRKEETFF